MTRCLYIRAAYQAKLFAGLVAARDFKINLNACEASVFLNASTNIWKNYTLHPSIDWRTKIEAATAAINVTNADLKNKALQVATYGTFVWIEGQSQIPKIEQAVKDVPCKNVLGLVISGLPYHECLPIEVKPPMEPYSYSADYIDPIVKILKSYPNTAFALIIEPGVVGNVVPNVNTSSCKHVVDSYRQNVPYALRNLNLPNVVMYLDGAHGGLLGWRYILKSAAQELADTYKAAGSPSQFRGLATNVAGYNSWDLSPGEYFADPDAEPTNEAHNEKRYILLLGKELQKTGMPRHSITDTSRSGVQGIRKEWGDWCNVNGAGFGRRPGTDTCDEWADAFVWVKWGGESDGTSDATSRTYESFCGKVDAFQPSPEKGEWNQAYFEMLLRNAKLGTKYQPC
ncbi:cellulase [Lindgomyces ingoldianus]|uniref:Cellulase n=1 Tax=Lindgomyces ingoldianus TaxID=673940 RepID=A0ACB6QBP9_9PLEO|nr:cellulase [Lindgomyces ingoldianus]KAF2463537.1 cellulase [Lindgomyces ingoldianus]